MSDDGFYGLGLGLAVVSCLIAITANLAHIPGLYWLAGVLFLVAWFLCWACA